MEQLVIESSPHVKNVNVKDEPNGDVHVNIELYFWYGLFFSRSYYRFIMRKFEDEIIMGIDCYITVR